MQNHRIIAAAIGKVDERRAAVAPSRLKTIDLRGHPNNTTGEVTPMHDLPNAAIRSTLAHRAGDTPDSGAIAEAALATWCCISDRLEPVIGRRGVDALFNRALHVTCKTYPWLAVADTDGNGTVQPAGLRLRLADREPAMAEDAGYLLLVTFTVLLANLIGESLTERLLEPVWSPPSANSDEMGTP